MSGAAFLRIKKLKGGGIILAAARHNRRVIQAELGATGSIDPSRICLNETLRGPSTSDEVAQLAKSLMRAAGVGKLRKDAVQALEIVFSLPPGQSIADTPYFKECVAWAGNYFGGDQNILSADIHRDEAQFHCHVLILPLINGRMDGSNLCGGKAKFRQMQQEFYSNVAARYGLRKGPPRLSGASRSASALMVINALKDASDGALASKAWPVIRDAIESDPAPFLTAFGLEMKAPAKKSKSMVDIFISKGKGRATEENHIGFQAPARQRTLCSVGFPSKAPPLPEHQEPLAHKFVRVRESDLDPALYDPDTGQYFEPPPEPMRQQRRHAEEWARHALQEIGLAK